MGLSKAQRHCCEETLEPDRGNTGWPGFIPMAWAPWHFWQLDPKVSTITPNSPFWAASSQQLWRAHTGTAREPLAKKFSLPGVFCWAERGCSEQLAVLHAAHLRGTCGTWRVTPVFSWGVSCQRSSGGHSRGCASCQTEWQWPCASWQSSWGHKSLSNACRVQTWAPATHFGRCQGLTNASTIRT